MIMKKWMVLPLAAALFGAGGCNNESEPIVYGSGAYYPMGNYIENYDGTKYTFTEFYGGDLTADRYYTQFSAIVPEGSPTGPGETVVASDLSAIQILPCSFFTEGADFDDPVVLTEENAEQINSNPGICLVDFLEATFTFPLYYENGENDYAASPEIHFQQLGILPGASGQSDTIDLRLYVDSKRADNELNRGTEAVTYIADLQSLDVPYEDKDYILKLNLRAIADANSEESWMTYLLAKWNPTKPYSPQ